IGINAIPNTTATVPLRSPANLPTSLLNIRATDICLFSLSSARLPLVPFRDSCGTFRKRRSNGHAATRAASGMKEKSGRLPRRQTADARGDQAAATGTGGGACSVSRQPSARRQKATGIALIGQRRVEHRSHRQHARPHGPPVILL